MSKKGDPTLRTADEEAEEKDLIDRSEKAKSALFLI
jgi:hypothetical protein